MTSKSGLDSKTLSILEKYHDANGIYVGYSGGMDSHVLLHIVSHFHDVLNKEIIAVHVNHGLNEKASQWADHCQSVCDFINLKLIQISVNASAPKGESQEEWARDLRYQAIMELIGKNDLFLTAHHKDDLAETLLLQLLRGAGPAGLAAMPEMAQLGTGRHVRPLLDFSREEIFCYATNQGLDWINDESNDDERFDRNYLRHRVMPVLKQRWPGMLKTLSRSADIQSGVNELIEDLAAQDMLVCLKTKNSTLSAQRLRELSNTRAINVIRYWLKSRQHRSPSARLLEQILTDVVNSEPDHSPFISWGG
ncbi:MAG: tRNA lysidine(34) synthetase TilS, partial [Gammaproteobacteria bacterium]|nr:tRNA lysidine(34) synthetase TilS [Gammaproteobacteria bacterium]